VFVLWRLGMLASVYQVSKALAKEALAQIAQKMDENGMPVDRIVNQGNELLKNFDSSSSSVSSSNEKKRETSSQLKKKE
jgi:hypothetical protein